ncbi:MAG: GLUG motif-containing protein [Bacilli bacterium]
MNKKRLLLLALLVAMPLIASCGSSSLASSDSSSPSSQDLPLVVPSEVALDGRIITWSPVSGAEGYDVKLNQEDDYQTPINEFELPDSYFGPLSIAVRAYRGEETTAYSPETNVTAILTLEAPGNFRQEGSELLWDAVTYATGYMVKIDTIEHFTLLTSYELDTIAPSQAQIRATGRNDGYVVASPFSDPLLIKAPLTTPTNITYTDGFLSWDAVANASSYEIEINEIHDFTSDTNTVSIGFDFVGEVVARVKAKATGDQYLDSSWGEANLSIDPLTLARPTNLYIEAGVLHFSEVAHATEYEIYLNDELEDTVTVNSFVLSGEILAQINSYLQVKAISAIHNPSPLSEKVFIGAVLVTNEAELRAMDSVGAYTLANNIALTLPWIPIDFAGYLNGAGHTISGLNLTGSQSATALGFFGTLEEATVTNLSLEGSFDVTLTGFEPNLGGLAGSAESSILSNLDIAIDIAAVATNGIANVGGIVGQSASSTYTRVIYEGAIASEHAISGGFIGAAVQSSEAVTIHKSAALGTIEVAGGEQSPTGGFIGRLIDNYLTITESKAHIDVTGPNYVGGFVGYMGSGTIENSYSKGAVTATGTAIVHVGGFVGRMEGYNNKVRYSIAMTTIAYTAGDTVHAGAFVGVTPGGSIATIYVSCHYDNTISSLDRIGNYPVGRGDGITGKTSSELLSLANYSLSIWDFSGDSPRLLWELLA